LKAEDKRVFAPFIFEGFWLYWDTRFALALCSFLESAKGGWCNAELQH